MDSEQIHIHGPDPIEMAGRHGARYWVYHPFTVTNNKEIDDRLTSYPVVVFTPTNRCASETPVLFSLQGMAAPMEWNAFLIPVLMDMGIATVMFESPLGGERSYARLHNGNIAQEIFPLLQKNVNFGSETLAKMMDIICQDFKLIREDILKKRHNLTSDKIALLGVSLGVILSGYAFCKDGFGQRLLGVIGHLDVPKFARSYMGIGYNIYSPIIGDAVQKVLMSVNAKFGFNGWYVGFLPLLKLLTELVGMQSTDTLYNALNPISHADNVKGRVVSLLVGEDDPLVNVEDAKKCAAHVNGNCYVVPGLKHGVCSFGPDFCQHVSFYVRTQLGDWSI